VDRDVALCRSADATNRDDSTWGLETKRHRARRRQRMNDAKNAVLKEQAAQWKEGERNDDLLLRVYERASEEARHLALHRGVWLAQALLAEESRRLKWMEFAGLHWTTTSPATTAGSASEVSVSNLRLSLMEHPRPSQDISATEARWVAQGKAPSPSTSAPAMSDGKAASSPPLIPIRQ
jgi:hypothetical protein